MIHKITIFIFFCLLFTTQAFTAVFNQNFVAKFDQQQRLDQISDENHFKKDLHVLIKHFLPSSEDPLEGSSSHLQRRSVVHYQLGLNDVGGTGVLIEDPRDFRIGKEMIRYASIDNCEIIAVRYFYSACLIEGEKWNCVEVYDALNQKIMCSCSEDGSKVIVDYYQKTEDGIDTLFKREKRFDHVKDEEGDSDVFIVENGGGGILFCEKNTYKNFQLIKNAIYGNLTGKVPQPVVLQGSGLPLENGVECYATRYFYGSQNDIYPQKAIEDNGQTFLYHYLPESHLVTAEYTCQGECIRIRKFYQYDENKRLIRSIVDNGTREGFENLEGVTERHLTVMTPGDSRDESLSDLPVLVEEKYLDLSTGQEVLLSTTLNTYSNQGKLIQQELFDAAATCLQSMKADYDEQGNAIYVADVDGSITIHTYGENGRLLTSESTKENCVTHYTYTYDSSERLIRMDQCDDTGRTTAICFRYDVKGNKITQCDGYGNETHFEYDALGRITKTVYPEVLDADDVSFAPQIQQRYDIFDNVIIAIDAAGDETRTAYNIRRQPIHITYSDGTEESFEYKLDGSLEKNTAKNGLKTIYEYDDLGRVLKTEIQDLNGTLLKATTSTYNAFHQLTFSDEFGTETIYEYDGAGREIRKSKQTKEGVIQSEFHYNGFGQIDQIQEWYGKEVSEYTKKVHAFDILSKKQKICFFDSSNRELKFLSLHSNNDCVKSNFYSFQNKEFINSRGQKVLQTIDVSSNGLMEVTTYDALGRVESRVEKNSLGEELLCKDMRYDGCGRKTHEIVTFRNSQQQGLPYVLSWEYGPMGRLLKFVEGKGSENQRSTAYFYHASGQLEKIIKPDGIELIREYNSLNLLSRVYSSDASIDYHFTYDIKGNLNDVKDFINQQHLHRSYNTQGLLTKEELSHEFAVSHYYDLQGRRTHLLLPDHSSVEYVYDAVYLRKIRRLDPSGRQLYVHEYVDYDCEGQLLTSSMISSLGELAFEWTKNRQCQTVLSEYWSEHIPGDGFDDSGNVVKKIVRDVKGEEKQQFHYDNLQQLEAEVGEKDQRYAYDSFSNRTGKNSQLYQLNDMHEVLSDGNLHCHYDINGNLISKESTGKTTRYQYDAFNRLIKVTCDDKTSFEYIYDAFHRRLSKKTLEWNEIAKSWSTLEFVRYLYDGDREIGTIDARGKILEFRVLGIGKGAEIGAAVALELDNDIYAPIHDLQGSLRCLVDVKTQQIFECYRYTAFGEESLFDGNGHSKVKAKNPWRFASKRYEEEIGLIYFGKRFYDPAFGRWITLDPMEVVGGNNRYAFVLNNPLTHCDWFGLFSVKDFFEGKWDYFPTLQEFTLELMKSFRKEIEKICDLRDTLERVGHQIVGKTLFFLAGYYSETPKTGVCGEGEVNPKVRVTHINGILNSHVHCIEAAALISELHGGVNVHYAYRATEGWTWDLIRCCAVKMGYVSSEAHQLAAIWKEMIAEMGGLNGGGLIIHYAHSIGGTETTCAQYLLTPEEKRMIRIITFGSATMVLNDGYESAVNYVNRRDGVSLLDPIGWVRGVIHNESNVVFVGSFNGLPFIDHAFTSDGYRYILENLGREFVKNYKSIKG